MDSNTILGKTILQFSVSYTNGYSSMKTINEILEIQQTKSEKYLIIPDFYSFLYGVCFQSAIINLSNILIYDKDTINLHHLRNLLRDQNHLIIENNSNESILELIQNILDRYSRNSDFYNGLKELRDKYIAHVDRSRVISPRPITKPISIGEINEAYLRLGELITRLVGEFAINPELIDYQGVERANLQLRLLTDALDQNIC